MFYLGMSWIMFIVYVSLYGEDKFLSREEIIDCTTGYWTDDLLVTIVY
jgi:hypothetical protein